MRSLSTTHPSVSTPAQELTVGAAHDGAGATTLARLLPPARDIGTVHPRARADTTTDLVADAPFLLACRPVTSSAIATTETIATLAQTGLTVAVLVISGDGWPEDPAATACYRRLAASVSAVVRMPFVADIRGFGHPENVRLPQDAQQVLTEIRLLATRPDSNATRAVHRVRCAA
jgi:hypothetical protein